MTKRELVEAYARGDLDRRSFVQKLTALGVGTAAALAYATQLAPAAAAGTGHGFIRQDGTDTDADADAIYGTAVELESDEEAVEAATLGEEAAQQLLADILSNFGPEDFEEFDVNGVDAYEQLQTLQQQLSDHSDAVQAALGDGTAATGVMGRSRPVLRLPAAQSSDLRTQLTDLHDVLDILASLYAGLTPAVQDPELRQTLANIAIVKGRQVAFVALLLGNEPFQETFEEPIGPDEAMSRLESIVGS